MSHYWGDEPDPGLEVGELRRKAMVAMLKYMADAFGESIGTVSPLQPEFDEACKALAAKLNEPETCYACGQVAPGDD